MRGACAPVPAPATLDRLRSPDPGWSGRDPSAAARRDPPARGTGAAVAAAPGKEDPVQPTGRTAAGRGPPVPLGFRQARPSPATAVKRTRTALVLAGVYGGLAAAVAAGLLALAAGRAVDRPDVPGREGDRLGLPRCPAEARDLLVDAALQCWFDDPAGRWRILSRLWAGDSLLVEAQAASLASARRIARHAVACCSAPVGEILVYVSEPAAAGQPQRIVRIRWTRQRGFEEIVFDVGGEAPGR